MRAVLDPNVLSSALISPAGPPREILTAWTQGRLDLVVMVATPSAGLRLAAIHTLRLPFDADHRVGQEHEGMGRTTLNLDTELVAEAKQALGARSQTEAIHMALAHVVRQQRLDSLAGRTFPDLTPDLLARLRGRVGSGAARPE